MPVLDTSVLIDKAKREEDIHENIAEISVLEYPSILKYQKFYGKIYYLKRFDLNLALNIQIKLRKIGNPKPIPTNCCNLHKQE
jgi:predicted nucleic acid-binding protein